MAPRIYLSQIDRLFLHASEDEAGCWIFNGALRNGYGVLGAGLPEPSRLVYAHRVAYEYFIADIPDGLHIDHLCRVRACCNPWHLEPVTQAENNRRAHRDNPKTHCKQGHEFTPENTRQTARQRHCRACATAYLPIKRAQRKAAA